MNSDSDIEIYNVKVDTVPSLLPLNNCGIEYALTADDAYNNSRAPNRKVIVGFDAEWPPWLTREVRTQAVTLIQMCINITDGVYKCYLFQLNAIGAGVPKCIVDLINDDRIVLSGVELLCDIEKLADDFNYRLAHRFTNHNNKFVDLNTLGNWIYDTDKKWGLSDLLVKTEKTDGAPRVSDWSRWPLSNEQRDYAAADGLAGLRIYEVIRAQSMHRLTQFSKIQDDLPYLRPAGGGKIV